MSTYIYLRCESHDPPIVADGESGQHTYDLPRLREDIANRHAIAAGLRAGLEPESGIHFYANTAYFLRDHEHCQLGIFDEYGGVYALDGDSREPIRKDRP